MVTISLAPLWRLDLLQPTSACIINCPFKFSGKETPTSDKSYSHHFHLVLISSYILGHLIHQSPLFYSQRLLFNIQVYLVSLHFALLSFTDVAFFTKWRQDPPLENKYMTRFIVILALLRWSGPNAPYRWGMPVLTEFKFLSTENPRPFSDSVFYSNYFSPFSSFNTCAHKGISMHVQPLLPHLPT